MLFSARAYVLDTKAAAAPLDKLSQQAAVQGIAAAAGDRDRDRARRCASDGYFGIGCSNGTVQTNGPALHSYSSVLSIDEVTAACRVLSYAVAHAMLHANNDDGCSAGTAAAAAAATGGGYANSSSNCSSKHMRAEVLVEVVVMLGVTAHCSTTAVIATSRTCALCA
jgi:hypothetical protein